jgi:hypothetical protein
MYQFYLTRRLFFLLGLCLIIFLSIASFYFYSAYTTLMIWDDSFEQAEYQVTFLDNAGEPISGVGLRVTSLDGNDSYYYPVLVIMSQKTAWYQMIRGFLCSITFVNLGSFHAVIDRTHFIHYSGSPQLKLHDSNAYFSLESNKSILFR